MQLDPVEIQKLLPHGPRMRLIDGVSHFNSEVLHAMSRRHQDLNNPLRRPSGTLPIAAGLEFAGQATALHGALIDSGDEPSKREGYLVMARDVSWTVDRLDHLASDLEIVVKLIHRNDLSAMYEYHLGTQHQPYMMRGRMAVYFQGAGM